MAYNSKKEELVLMNSIKTEKDNNTKSIDIHFIRHSIRAPPNLKNLNLTMIERYQGKYISTTVLDGQNISAYDSYFFISEEDNSYFVGTKKSREENKTINDLAILKIYPEVDPNQD